MTTAAITDVQTALKTAIETAAGVEGTFALPLSVSVADSVAAKPPTPDDPVSVQIAYTGVAELARASTLVLDQGLVSVYLSYRHPDDDQTRLDACHQVAERLRDILGSWSANGARVEQLLTPNPFDQPAARQGSFEHRLTLDMDILRTVGESSPAEVTDNPILTDARNAVWDAIDNWPAFAADGDTPAAWTRKYKDPLDVAELSLHDPGVADLPAIAVTWGPTTANWWTHQMQQWGQQLVVTFWLPADSEAVAEWRLMQLMQAVYQSAPVESPSVSYVRRATGRPPTKNSPLTLEMIALGRAQRLHAWRGQIALTLTTNLDPNA